MDDKHFAYNLTENKFNLGFTFVQESSDFSTYTELPDGKVSFDMDFQSIDLSNIIHIQDGGFKYENKTIEYGLYSLSNGSCFPSDDE